MRTGEDSLNAGIAKIALVSGYGSAFISAI
jgi:hypothetical protein